MTRAREALLVSLQRRRSIVSWSTALGLYLFAIGLSILLTAFGIKDYGDYSGPVVVRIGSPDGADSLKPAPQFEEPAVMQAQEAQVEQPGSRPEPVPARKADGAQASQTAKQESQAQVAPSSQTQAAEQPEQTVLRGSESGNSYDMTLMASPGIVGRGVYTPVWMFMPLPTILVHGIYEKIPDKPGLSGTAEERKAVFKKHYKESGNEWQLSGFRQPDYDARVQLWPMLEEAGYDIKNAEYKTQNKLRPVVILFKVSAPGASGKPQLLDIHIESGSGMSTIDNDVLNAFKSAEFYNSGDTSISGRYTYRF